MNSLDPLFNPKSIAVIGASQTPFRAGSIVMTNLLQGGYKGVIMPVSIKTKSVHGILAYPNIEQLPLVPDLAILCTNAQKNEAIFAELAAKNVKSVLVISSEMGQIQSNGMTVDEACLNIAKANNMRILGSNSIGLLLPWQHLNASLSPVQASQGNIAFISQSAAVCTTILDWAKDKGLGFSAFISLGNTVDIDFPELLDRLSVDSKTSAILLYIDSIKDARRFISAARSASRNRRIVVLKNGRSEAGQRASLAHTGGLQSVDVVYDSAIRRSGMLRVHNTHELFAALETLTHSVPLRGERLTIISNGGGPAIMALDALMERGGRLAQFDQENKTQLLSKLSPRAHCENPIDLSGDALPQHYVQALNHLFDTSQTDAILIMHSPSAMAPAKETAQAIINCIKDHPKSGQFNILTNWFGEHTAKEGRRLFTQANIATYRTPEGAVGAFMHLVKYRRNQKQLMATPLSLEQQKPHLREQANNWGEAQSELKLRTPQISELLELYNINVLNTYLLNENSTIAPVLTSEQLIIKAEEFGQKIGYPVTLKAFPTSTSANDQTTSSSAIRRFSQLTHALSVKNTLQACLDDANALLDHEYYQFTLQKTIENVDPHKLRIRIDTDPVFGPVLKLGQGRPQWTNDVIVALLPLNTALADYLLLSAVQDGILRFEQNLSKEEQSALSRLMVRLSQLMIDSPRIDSIYIHSFAYQNNELTVVEAQLTLSPKTYKRTRLAIKPYPVELEEIVELKNRENCLFRPIFPEDESQLAQFISKVSKEDLYKRFFSDMGEFNHETLAHLTQIDYDREMAFVAVMPNNDIIGVARVILDPKTNDAEFSVLVRSDLKGIGLGKKLMTKLITYSKNKGTKKLVGVTMPSNKGMVGLAKHLGFKTSISFEDNIVDMVMVLE